MDWSDIEIWLRLLPFIMVFSIIAFLELVIPRRPIQYPKPARWINNIALILLSTIFVRVLIPGSAVGIALLSHSNHWGFFNTNLFASVASWIVIVISIILLDFFIWYQHLMFHKIPLFWRFHRVHHSDLDMDVTTSVRFHPVEIILSIIIKSIIIVIFGLPATSVLIFEIVLNASAMFNHSNIRIAKSIEKLLRMIFVTPDMHRIHHSVDVKEHNSNFGFFLSCWDYLFKTYIAKPKHGQINMQIGLQRFQSKLDQRIDKLLTQPIKP